MIGQQRFGFTAENAKVEDPPWRNAELCPFGAFEDSDLGFVSDFELSA